MGQKKEPDFIITKEDLLQGLEQALPDYRVAGLINKNGKYLYDYIQHPQELLFTYHPTVLSPKKFFFPPKEPLFAYSAEGKISATIVANPLVLFGIRPCDLNGFKILHEAFADDHGDPNYLEKVKQTVVVGIDCDKICDQHAFCFKVKAQNATAGFDLMLAENPEGFAGEIATTKGENFINKYFVTNKPQGDELAIFQERKKKNFAGKHPFKNLAKLPEIFAQNKHHPIWETEGGRCLSCGSCIMVCPTCYCFDVNDEWQLNLQQGKRIRSWDACMLAPFATVGSGENFRHSAVARLHHRLNRKFNFLMKKHKQAVCVGCGRCVRACLADISPRTIATAIAGD
jgi:sulfhydrogenase subunit beta (sulfur reductase)